MATATYCFCYSRNKHNSTNQEQVSDGLMDSSLHNVECCYTERNLRTVEYVFWETSHPFWTIVAKWCIITVKQMVIHGKWLPLDGWTITLYTPTIVCLFPLNFLGCLHGEFWLTIRIVGDHFLHSHDLNLWFRGDIVRRN